MKNIILFATITLFFNQCRNDRLNEIDLKYSPQKVELFAEGFISTNLYEHDIAISPNSDEIIFTLSDYRQSKHCLVRVKKQGNLWGKKEILGFSEYDRTYRAMSNKHQRCGPMVET